MDSLIKVWYEETYPEDTLGQDLNNKASFKDFLSAVACNKVYETMGVGDSLVRERLFTKLSELTGKSYSAIYDLWLSGALKEV